MVHMDEVGTAYGERERVVAREAAAAEARSRFRLIAHLLPITGLEEYLMAEAAMIVARGYARECGAEVAGPGERRVVEEEWDTAIRRLRDALRV